MPIQWFPGHMTQARKQAAEAMASTDVVIDCLLYTSPSPRD